MVLPSLYTNMHYPVRILQDSLSIHLHEELNLAQDWLKRPFPLDQLRESRIQGKCLLIISCRILSQRSSDQHGNIRDFRNSRECRILLIWLQWLMIWQTVWRTERIEIIWTEWTICQTCRIVDHIKGWKSEKELIAIVFTVITISCLFW